MCCEGGVAVVLEGGWEEASRIHARISIIYL